MLFKLLAAAVMSGIKTYGIGIFILMLLFITCNDLLFAGDIVAIVSMLLVIPFTFGMVFFLVCISLLFIKREYLRRESAKSIFITYLPFSITLVTIPYSLMLTAIHFWGYEFHFLLLLSYLLVFVALYQSLSEIKKFCL